jgi:hypothetical protein
VSNSLFSSFQAPSTCSRLDSLGSVTQLSTLPNIKALESVDITSLVVLGSQAILAQSLSNMPKLHCLRLRIVGSDDSSQDKTLFHKLIQNCSSVRELKVVFDTLDRSFGMVSAMTSLSRVTCSNSFECRISSPTLSENAHRCLRR